jgi:hypothetical protein
VSGGSKNKLARQKKKSFVFSIFRISFMKPLEIKTSGLVLEFEMSFQQQQHSAGFMLLYSAVTLEVIGMYVLYLIRFFEVIKQLLSKTFFNKLSPSCHFQPLRFFLAPNSFHEVGGKK